MDADFRALQSLIDPVYEQLREWENMPIKGMVVAIPHALIALVQTVAGAIFAIICALCALACSFFDEDTKTTFIFVAISANELANEGFHQLLFAITNICSFGCYGAWTKKES